MKIHTVDIDKPVKPLNPDIGCEARHKGAPFIG